MKLKELKKGECFIVPSSYGVEVFRKCSYVRSSDKYICSGDHGNTCLLPGNIDVERS